MYSLSTYHFNKIYNKKLHTVIPKRHTLKCLHFIALVTKHLCHNKFILICYLASSADFAAACHQLQMWREPACSGLAVNDSPEHVISKKRKEKVAFIIFLILESLHQCRQLHLFLISLSFIHLWDLDTFLILMLRACFAAEEWRLWSFQVQPLIGFWNSPFRIKASAGGADFQ